MHLDIQFVHRHPILEVSIKPVRLFDQHYANGRMRLEKGHHLAEGGAARLLGSFDVDIFLHHREVVRRRVFFEELQLRRDREAFLFLLLGGNARIDHSVAGGGIGNGCGLRGVFHAV